MSCATKIDQSMTTGPLPIGQIDREAKWLIGDGPYQPVKDDPRSTGQDIVRNGPTDSEHRDPELVWGDEGPVYD
jgi:hypothetical protein